MVTPWYCPNCGLRLWEESTREGIVPNSYWCRNMHWWTIRDDIGQEGKIVMRGDGNPEGAGGSTRP